MKMVYCTCNVSVLEQLTAELRKHRVCAYQTIREVTGISVRGEPRLNTPVWPGYNSAVVMQFSDDERAAEIIQTIRDFNSRALNDNELVTCCSWKLDEYFYE